MTERKVCHKIKKCSFAEKRGTEIKEKGMATGKYMAEENKILETEGERKSHLDGHHSQGHVHSEGYEKAIVHRISRAIGHLESIKRMVEGGKDCSEVLIQLAAVKAAVNNTGKVILKEHLEHCIVDAIEHGDTESVEKLNRAIDIFIK